jgi:Arm DNA-binding domain
MPRNLLTDKTIQKAAKEGLKRLTDGDGLYLLLNVNGGSHGWRLDYIFGGKRKTLSLASAATAGVHPTSF